jgi:hypothetical protein
MGFAALLCAVCIVTCSCERRLGMDGSFEQQYVQPLAQVTSQHVVDLDAHPL